MTQPTQSLQDLLIAYIQGPDQLEAALNGLSDADLDKRGSDGWSIRQIVHHLTDGDFMWSLFMKAAIITPGCLFNFDWYRSNDIVSQVLYYTERPIDAPVQLFRANCTLISQLLTHIPNVETRYVQTGSLDEEDRVFIPQIIGILTQHVYEHVEEIQRLRDM